MPSVSITNPANDGDPFPAVITGTYSDQGLAAVPAGDVAALAAVVGVAVTNQGTGVTDNLLANGVDGEWSVNKPAGLPARALYTITATYGTATATKIDIQN